MFSGALVYYGFFVAIGAASSLLFSDILRVNGLAIGTAPTIGMAIAMAVVLCLCARVFYRAFHGLSKAKRLLLALVALMIAVCVPAEKLVKRPAGDFWADITALGIRNSQSNSNEVWLSSVMVDGKEIALSDLALSQGWSYASESNSVWASPEDEQATDALRIGPFPGIDSFELFFGEHAWSGIVRIDTAMESREVDLYAPESSSIQVGSFAMQGGPYTTGNKLKLLLCYLVIAAWLFVGMVCLAINQKVFFPIAYAQLTVTVFLLSPYVRPAPSVMLFLGMLSTVAYVALERYGQGEALRPYFQRGKAVLLGLVCMYGSFASFGYRLFLAGPLMSFSLDRLSYFIFGAIWFLPVITLLLVLLEGVGERSLTLKRPDESNGKGALKVAIVSALIFLAAISIGFIGFYPGGFPTDAVVQLNEAITNNYNNGHPVVHTLINKFFWTICPKPGFVVFGQLVIMAVLIGRIAVIAYGCGIKQRTIYAFALVFALLPNQTMTNVSPLKDFMFSYALVWAAILLFELALDITKARRIGYLIEMTLCLFFIKELRHNGIISMVLISILLVIVTIKHWRTVKLYAASSVAAAIGLILLTEGPLFSMLKVAPVGMSPTLTMFCAVGSCINKGKTFSEETTQKLERVMPLEDWANYYGRFVGCDYYLYSRAPGSTMDLGQFTMKEAFQIYFEALSKYPDIVIKDRLDGMNLMWDITQPDDEDSFNFKRFLMITVNDAVGLRYEGLENWDLYNPHNPIADSYYIMESFAFPGERTQDQLHDMLLWRTGAYLLFFLVLLLYWIKNGLKKMLWPALPMLGNVLSMILALYHQSFRYVYFIQLSVLVLILMTFAMKGQLTKPMAKEE